MSNPKAPKMTMGEQAGYLSLLCDRFKMVSGPQAGELAATAEIVFDRDDMARLMAIADTLRLMDTYGADAILRDEIRRRRSRR